MHFWGFKIDLFSDLDWEVARSLTDYVNRYYYVNSRLATVQHMDYLGFPTYIGRTLYLLQRGKGIKRYLSYYRLDNY